MKILLIDPDEYYHHQFRQVLEPNFEILAARDSISAGDLIREHEIAMVIVELLLADGLSFDLIRDIRSKNSQNPPTVIVFSGASALEDIEEALGLGVSGYFVKGRDSIQDVNKLLLTFIQNF